MKLISLSDFLHVVDLSENPYKKVIDYDSFLRQKLELWMFVPCKLVDGGWVVLEEPKPENYFNVNTPINEYSESDKKGLHAYYSPMMEFEEAKEHVLFEGFTLCAEKHAQNGNIFIGLGFKNGIYQIVEDLVNHPNWPKKEEIELTISALKQIGL